LSAWDSSRVLAVISMDPSSAAAALSFEWKNTL
jgi:hypothetical protein